MESTKQGLHRRIVGRTCALHLQELERSNLVASVPKSAAYSTYCVPRETSLQGPRTTDDFATVKRRVEEARALGTNFSVSRSEC